jgi:hypothetical protein
MTTDHLPDPGRTKTRPTLPLRVDLFNPAGVRDARSMTIRAAHVGMVLGGFAVGVASTSPMPTEYAFVIVGSHDGTLYTSGVVGAVLGALVAVVVAARLRARLGLAMSAVSGLTLLAIGPVVGFSPVVLYTNGIGVGLLLGGLAGLSGASDRARLQTALAAGVVGGLLLAGPLDQYRHSTAVPTRYADYLLEPPHNTDLLALAFLAVTAIVVMVALQSGDFDASSESSPDRPTRPLVVGLVLPVLGLLLYWQLVRAIDALGTGPAVQDRWILGVALVPVVIAAAVWLENRTGTVLLAATAFIAASEGAQTAWFTDSWLWLLVPAALVALGAALGRILPQPLFGIAALALVAVSAVFDTAPWDNLHTGAVVLLLPAAAAFTLTASLPSSAPVVTTSLAGPAAFAIPLTADFGWTAYAPLKGGDSAFEPSAWDGMSTAAPVVAVVACGLAIAYLQRRPAR